LGASLRFEAAVRDRIFTFEKYAYRLPDGTAGEPLAATAYFPIQPSRLDAARGLTLAEAPGPVPGGMEDA
jgi:hypothetical protein